MGRKKKKVAKPWCWYCNREFEDEKILIQHQKAKHFKCHICGKKLFTGPGLAIHCMQVHKETIDKIPAALPGHDSVEIEVYGMEGIPPEGYGEPKPKQPRPEVPMMSSIPTPAQVQPPQFGVLPYGMMPMTPMNPYAAMPGMYPGMPAMQVPLPASAPVTQIKAPPTVPQPPAPMFPAYQGGKTLEINISSKSLPDGPSTSAVSAVASAIAAAVVPPSMKPMSSKTRIVCADEYVSLEERMATRFKNMNYNRTAHYMSR